MSSSLGATPLVDVVYFRSPTHIGTSIGCHVSDETYTMLLGDDPLVDQSALVNLACLQSRDPSEVDSKGHSSVDIEGFYLFIVLSGDI